MYKYHLKPLERIYEAEISGRLPLQSRARVYHRLKEMGLVEWGSEVKGSMFSRTMVEGWYLTQAGRLAYCLSCSEEQATQG